MFYKIKNGEWMAGHEVHFPDGIKLTKKSKAKKDEWEWFDNPPKKYVEWEADIIKNAE